MAMLWQHLLVSLACLVFAPPGIIASSMEIGDDSNAAGDGTWYWSPQLLASLNDGQGGHDTLYFQSDGNIVMYNNAMQPLWNSNTAGNDCSQTSCQLVWTRDGNLYISIGGQDVWATGTTGQGKFLVFSTEVPYVGIYDHNHNEVWPINTVQRGQTPPGGGGPPPPDPCESLPCVEE